MTYFTNEDWFDALEDFRGPDINMEWTPEDDKKYNAYLAKRHSVATVVADPAELEQQAKAKTFAFYTEEAIANELSPFDI